MSWVTNSLLSDDSLFHENQPLSGCYNVCCFFLNMEMSFCLDWLTMVCLTPLVLVYDIFVLWTPTFSCYFRATLQLHNSPGNWARELFKPSKDVASLLDCAEKNGKFLISCFLWVMSSVGYGLAFSAKVMGHWTSTTRDNFLTQVFIGN